MNWSYRFSFFLFIYFILQPHLIAWFSIGGTRLSLSLSRFPVSAPAAPGPGPHGGHRALALASLNWSLSLGVCHRHRPRAQTLPNCGHYGQPVNVVSASLLLTTPPNSGVQSAAVNVIIIICVSYSWPRHSIFLLLTILWPIGEQLMFVELGAVSRSAQWEYNGVMWPPLLTALKAPLSQNFLSSDESLGSGSPHSGCLLAPGSHNAR